MAKKEKIPVDRFGNELKLGDTVVVTATHHRFTGTALYFGVIEKIAPQTKYLTVKTMNESERSADMSCVVKDPHHIALLDESFYDRVIMQKMKSA